MKQGATGSAAALHQANWPCVMQCAAHFLSLTCEEAHDVFNSGHECPAARMDSVLQGGKRGWDSSNQRTVGDEGCGMEVQGVKDAAGMMHARCLAPHTLRVETLVQGLGVQERGRGGVSESVIEKSKKGGG
jgi:hypothetical protein